MPLGLLRGRAEARGEAEAESNSTKAGGPEKGALLSKAKRNATCPWKSSQK